MNDPLKPSLEILCKLGSIAVHVEEAMSSKAHKLDVMALKGLLQDVDLKRWVKEMGVYMPVKR